MKIWPNSPVHMPKYDGILPFASASPNSNASPIAINSVSSTNSTNLKIMDPNSLVNTPAMVTDTDEFVSISSIIISFFLFFFIVILFHIL